LNMFLMTMATQICPTMKWIFEHFGTTKKNMAYSSYDYPNGNFALILRLAYMYIIYELIFFF